MKRICSVVVIGCLVVLAGCSGGSLDPDCSRDRGGFLSGVIVETPPENATVVESDRIPEDATFVRETIEATVGSDGSRTELTASEVCRVQETLTDLPRYDGDRFGYYVRHDGAVVRLQLGFET